MSIFVLLISLLVLAVFTILAVRRSLPGFEILAICGVASLAVVALPATLFEITGGKAAFNETLPWILLVSITVPFVWLFWRTRSTKVKTTVKTPTAPKITPLFRLFQHLRSSADSATNADATSQQRPTAHARVVKATVDDNGPRPQQPKTIFISYRREDSADVTGRLYDRLITEFGRGHVYKDVDTIPLGVDFREHINTLVGTCDVVLAVIGRQWLTAGGPDSRRLDDAHDPVRIEIVTALNRRIPVVPVLVGGVAIPSADVLPEDMVDLAFRNGTHVRPDPDFHKDVDRLVAALREN